MISRAILLVIAASSVADAASSRSGAAGFVPAPLSPLSTSVVSAARASGGRMGLRGGAASGLRMADIKICKDVDSVGKALCEVVEESAKKAMEEKGHFAFTIPGGSILKMLSGLKGDSSIDWSKATMAWVNHRAVPLDDETSTDFKAQSLFLKSWEEQGLNVIKLTGSTDAVKEEEAYAKALKSLPSDVCPPNADGVPMFDLSLIGMGTDGHIGSLYPDTPATAEREKLVVSVVKPASSSISLSLPVMLASKRVVVASAGKSDKYPLGKAEGVKRALEGDETTSSFPASALRGKALWILDEDSAVCTARKVIGVVTRTLPH
eukprot:CAMPEP_0169460576 /NCGR_PEP_ID=MMETSP1042-20121227/18566_1 /TAXON_ID=464988 /ORGANISM="Hemiselmis andersenii, Strain CCMP1180" /LENGTH=320 /DNA_ID=CAMNT_0009573087 /DNA_START=39 /DNA_END=1001 /DNA_ORIENTATION=-